MKGRHYLILGSSDGCHHFVLIDWIPKPKKTLSEKEAKRVSKKEASIILFLIRE
jgi:hypothetical protein